MTSQSCPSPENTTLLLVRLAKQVMRRCGAETTGLDLRWLMALSYLADYDGSPQQELVDAFWMDAKNVVLLLNELEEAGYLVRRRDLEDRRRHRVYITDAGREALQRAAEAQEQIEDEALAALDADERATLCRLLSRAIHGTQPAAGSEREAAPASS